MPERTPEGAKRSAAVEAKRRLVRAGSRGTIGPERGKLINCLGWNGAKRNGRRVQIKLGVRVSSLSALEEWPGFVPHLITGLLTFASFKLGNLEEQPDLLSRDPITVVTGLWALPHK